MRALECDCGQHLEATDDQKLFDKAQEHVNRDHPEMQLSAKQVREIVAENAYDKKPDILAGIDIPPRASAYMGGAGMPPSSTRPMLHRNREGTAQEAEREQEEKGLIDKTKYKRTSL